MSFLNFFKSKKKLLQQPVNLNVLRCDVHSHFIPGIDDGASTLSDSLLLIKRLKDLGYEKIITTPHIMSDYYRNTPEIIKRGLTLLNEFLTTNETVITLEAAAEYYLDYDFERKLEEKNILTFGDNYLLTELSFMNPPENLNAILFKMITSGYKPVLAHPERYTYWHRTPEKYNELVEKGWILQMNINSLTGYYSPEVKKISEYLIDEKLVRLVGSDCHHAGHIDLMERVVYEPYLDILIQQGELLNSSL